MEELAKIRTELGDAWIPEIYEERIRPLRTRRFEMEIPERENAPMILETLLGMELKVGRRRIACPDVRTARYLRVFARIGCKKIAIPYDITQLAGIADELERAFAKTEQVILRLVSGRSPQHAGRIRAAVIRTFRNEIKTLGAGDLMPLFNRSTKQREN